MPSRGNRRRLRWLLVVAFLLIATGAAPPPDPAPTPRPPATPPAPAPPVPEPPAPAVPEPAPPEAVDAAPPSETVDAAPEPSPAPVEPVPVPVPPGTAGADLVEAVGVRSVPPRTSAAEAPPPVADPAPTREADGGSTTSESPPPAADGPAADAADAVPTDGVVLLVGLLTLGLGLGVRAVRARQRTVGVGLMTFCAAYLALLGALLTGVALAAAPATLVATAPAPDRVELRWTVVPDLPAPTAWRVLRDDVAIADLAPEATAFTDHGVRPATSYHYAVRAVDDPPEEPSSTATVTTPAAEPPEPPVPPVPPVPTVPVPPVPPVPPPPPPPPVPLVPTASSRPTAPPAVRDLRVVARPRSVVVSWRFPPGRTGVAAVVVVRRIGRPPTGLFDGRVLLRGAGRSLVDHPVSSRPVHYAVWTLDVAGRPSVVARASLRRFLPALRTPVEGAVVGPRPVLRWRPVPGARYYNVQIWRGSAGRKVVTAWPEGPTYRPRRLRPGRYTWYVYPGRGPRAAARYGSLIGSGTFSVSRVGASRPRVVQAP